MIEKNAFKVVDMFEKRVAEYCGSEYCVAVDSGTEALFLCCKYCNVGEVTIPSKTYISVPMAIIRANGEVKFEDFVWRGVYRLQPFNIIDACRRFTKDMYKEFSDNMVCLSFHGKKILNIGKGGAVLTNKKEIYEWLKCARYDGRHEGVALYDDKIEMIGYHNYMTPEIAAKGLNMMMFVADYNEDVIDNSDIDLSKLEIFK